MQDEQKPTEEEATGVAEETSGFSEVDTESQKPGTLETYVNAVVGATGIPVGMITGIETPPQEQPPGKYDAVYNPQAHSRSHQPHRAKKVLRLFNRGEQIEIRGALFKVTAVGHKTMTLQILPQQKETETSD